MTATREREPATLHACPDMPRLLALQVPLIRGEHQGSGQGYRQALHVMQYRRTAVLHSEAVAEANLHVGAREVGVGHEGAREDLCSQVCADVRALAQVQHLVGHCIRLADGVADVATVAAVGVCTGRTVRTGG